jgi:heme/copper-type cytochrome/quinol oxidase subunit 2
MMRRSRQRGGAEADFQRVQMTAIQIASFEPHSSQAVGLVQFSIFIYTVCAAILLPVTGLVSDAVIRFRGRPGQPDPKPGYGRVKLEVAWTLKGLAE